VGNPALQHERGGKRVLRRRNEKSGRGLGLGFCRVSRLFAAGLVTAVLPATPAHAVGGGQEDDGPLKLSAVMVLGSAGNVCTGIVVAPAAILTAAHCVTNAAQHRVHFMRASGEPALIEPSAIAVHPGYDSGAIEGRRRSIDLALVRLPSPLPGPFAPAALSSAGTPPRAGATVTLGGYGGTGGRGRADGRFRSAELSVIEPYGPGRVLLWLGEPASKGKAKGGAGACHGDSGGPIAFDGAVVAVTAWSGGAGRTTCGPQTQGVLVGPQRGFIDRTLAGWGTAAVWK
jgi:hypothetical protein